MQKLLFFLLISMNVYSMEESPDTYEPIVEPASYGTSNNYMLFNGSDEAPDGKELDGKFQEEVLVNEVKKKSIKLENKIRINHHIENNPVATWEILPYEMKLRIVSSASQAMKDGKFQEEVLVKVMLLNKEFKALTEDPDFLESLARTLVKEDLKTAVKKYAYAYESQNKDLMKAFSKADIRQMITREAGFEHTSTETFAQALMKCHRQEAHKIFVKAVQKKASLLVLAFLAAGINIDKACNSLGHNALMEASLHGNQEIAQLLLTWGADINAQNTKYGWSPLYLAVCNRQGDIISLLCDHGADIEVKMKDTGTTPLIKAAQLGYHDIVNLLIACGANVNVQELAGSKSTPLIYAAHNGHIEMVKLLLEREANAHMQDAEGYTALMHACVEGHEEIVGKLLKYSDIYAKNKAGFTALQCVENKYASRADAKYLIIIGLLLSNGAATPQDKTPWIMSYTYNLISYRK